MGFFIGILFSSSLVIIDQFNVKCIIPFKAEDDAPIGPYGHSPQPFQFAPKRVQPIPGDIQSLRCRGGIENCKNSLNRLQEIRSYATSVASFIEAFQASVLKLLIITSCCKVIIVTCQ